MDIINIFQKISKLFTNTDIIKHIMICTILVLSVTTVFTWNQGTPSVTKEQAIKRSEPDARPKTDEQVSRGAVNRADIQLMAQVIEGEAAGEPLVGKVAVGAVIINRWESEEFPKNIRQVIYQPHAFEAVSNGQYRRPISQDSVRATELALNGWDPTNGCLYYWNPKTATSKWVWQRPVIMQIGQHVFAK